MRVKFLIRIGPASKQWNEPSHTKRKPVPGSGMYDGDDDEESTKLA